MWMAIDGNNWFAQCFYASPDQAEIAFARRLETCMQQLQPDHVFMCWDNGATFRHELFPGYKAQRMTKPNGFDSALRRTKARIRTLDGVTALTAAGYEADDCIASAVSIAKHEGQQVIIFSADRDLHQCLVPGSVTQVTKVMRESANQMRFDTINAERLEEKYGVPPCQWVDYRVMIGDASDGIPGCKGVGPKAAARVLQVHGDLDEFYKDPWKSNLTNKQRNALLQFRKQVSKKRMLIRLVNDLFAELQIEVPA